MKQEKLGELTEELLCECPHIYDVDFDRKEIIIRDDFFDNREYFKECLSRMVTHADEWDGINEVCKKYGIKLTAVKAFPSRDSVRFTINEEELPKSFYVEIETETEVGLREVWYDEDSELWYVEGNPDGMTTIKELHQASQP
jgi:hypothetical protein